MSFFPFLDEAFFADNWQKKPLVDVKVSPEDVKHIISLDEVEFLISSTPEFGEAAGSAFGWIELVKPYENLIKSTYTTSSKFIDLARVFEAYNQGYTILMTKMHKRQLSVAHICRLYEKLFFDTGVMLSSPVKANLYLTPSHSEGFPIHFDDHDVFVLQISGKKRWSIYDSPEQMPIRKYKPLSRDKVEALDKTHEFEMRPGNWAYIPRGYYHNAYTETEFSLHITFSVNTLNWIDIAHKVMASSVSFRKAIPKEVITSCREEQNESFRGLMSELSSRDFMTCIDEQCSNNLEMLDIFPDQTFSSINKLSTISNDTLLRKRIGLFSTYDENEDGYVLKLSGLPAYNITKKVKPVIDFIFTVEKFAVSDLPTSLSLEQKIKLVQSFIVDGFLVVVCP